MITPTEHAQLLRELADSVHTGYATKDARLAARACQAADEIEEGNEKHRELFATLYQVLGAHNASTEVLDAVSNAAVGKYSGDPFSLLPYSPPDTEEIEGREVPSDDELQELWIDGNWYNEGATLREFGSITRLVLARFGGGEGES